MNRTTQFESWEPTWTARSNLHNHSAAANELDAILILDLDPATKKRSPSRGRCQPDRRRSGDQDPEYHQTDRKTISVISQISVISP